jgi:putative redox protein
MKTERLKFQNQEGIELSARVDFPIDKSPIAYALFAHCFTCNKNLNAVKNISRSLTSKGFAVMLFDFTGLGSSDGKFENTSFTTNINDLIAASDFLAENYKAPEILIGHSLGGAAALFTAGKLENIKAVVTIGAPFDPQHVTHLLSGGVEEIKEQGKAEVNIGGRPFIISKQFIEDLESKNAETVAKDLRKPLLIMHSPIDTTVGIDNAAKMYSAAHHPKSFITLDGADHLLSKKEDSLYAGSLIASWVTKYIDIPTKVELKGSSNIISKTGNENFTTEIKAGNHHLIADEPESVGGLDLGPSPYDLLASGLAACTSMTLQMYAKRKKWDLQEANVHIEHNKDYAKDCETCEESGSKIDHFYRKIELIGELNEDQKAKLLVIADKCPVHKTLHSEVKVVSELKG